MLIDIAIHYLSTPLRIKTSCMVSLESLLCYKQDLRASVIVFSLYVVNTCITFKFILLL